MDITYLLGAGASSGCLPMYGNFRKRFQEFIGFFQFILSNNDAITEAEKKEIASFVLKMKKIAEELKFHNTPDTLAKKYFHVGALPELFLLKSSLIIFFIYEQSIDPDVPVNEQMTSTSEKEFIDKRYDSFIASLLKPISNKLQLLGHVKILTWNYDLQFEITYSRYKAENIITVQDYVQSFPKISPGYPELENNLFSIVHLNGIAFPKFSTDDFDLSEVGYPNIRSREFCLYLCSMFKAIEQHKLKHADPTRLLSFAWEKMTPNYGLRTNETLSNAMTIAEGTRTLIINGYSFPIFNRAIDVKILQAMVTLDKIYVQNPSAKEIIPLLLRIFEGRLNKNQIEDVGYWNQFFIPDWLFESTDTNFADSTTI